MKSKLTEMAASADQFLEVVKKQKLDNSKASECSPYFETIAQTLWQKQRDVRNHYDDLKISTLEIEVRDRVVSYKHSS